MLVQLFDDRQDFLVDEFRRGLPEQPLFLGEVLACEDLAGADRLGHESSAAGGLRARRHECGSRG
jgi:hypothetical protein